MVGTTVRAGDEVPTSFRDAFEEVGIALDDAEISGIRGRSKREAIIHLLDVHPGTVASVEGVYARFQDSLRTAYRVRATAVAGAEETFRSLQESGVAVVLITGLDRETTDLLVRCLRWESLNLHGVITGDDVRRGRPAPDLIEAAMSRVGVEDPRRVLVVGDTTSDLDAAAAAGVGWSVGVLSGAHGREALDLHPHSALLPSVADLPAWLATHPPSAHG